jgi:hypothetical protein
MAAYSQRNGVTAYLSEANDAPAGNAGNAPPVRLPPPPAGAL